MTEAQSPSMVLSRRSLQQLRLAYSVVVMLDARSILPPQSARDKGSRPATMKEVSW